MFASVRTRLFRAFGDWAIKRAMRTPYTHLFHDDGRPYMERFWLLRVGMPKNWRRSEQRVRNLEYDATNLHGVGMHWLAREKEQIATTIRSELYPRFGIRIHRIMSSDDRAFHDHPWSFTTLILRGGYTEYRPTGFDPELVTVADDYDGSAPTEYNMHLVRRFEAGSLIRHRAADWHYLVLDQGSEAWTMFCTGRKQQGWGFLVDGLLKVPYALYLRKRKERMVRDAQWHPEALAALHSAGTPPAVFNTIKGQKA